MPMAQFLSVIPISDTVSLLSSWGWLFIPVGLFGSIIGWLILGMVFPFEDDKSRQDWLWSGLLIGVLMAIMYVYANR